MNRNDTLRSTGIRSLRRRTVLTGAASAAVAGPLTRSDTAQRTPHRISRTGGAGRS